MGSSMGNNGIKSPPVQQPSNTVTSRSPLHQQQNADSVAASAGSQKSEQQPGISSSVPPGSGYMGSQPNTIEEGEEPPGQRVLPA